jgi:hypothetical protein
MVDASIGAAGHEERVLTQVLSKQRTGLNHGHVTPCGQLANESTQEIPALSKGHVSFVTPPKVHESIALLEGHNDGKLHLPSAHLTSPFAQVTGVGHAFNEEAQPPKGQVTRPAPHC